MTVTFSRHITHGRPAAYLLEDIEWLLDADPRTTSTQLGNRLHLTPGAIQQACRRAGRTDLLAQLARNARLHEGIAS